MTARGPVAIVGGGAGGLGAALALATQGVSSVVYEKSANSHEIDRGDVIHTRSYDLLRAWGAWPHLAQLGPRPFSAFRILDQDGRALLSLDTASTLGPTKALWALRHTDIVRGLRSAASSDSRIELRDATPVDDLLVEDGRVTGVLTRSGPRQHPFTLVATGSRSVLRDTHFGKPVEHDWDRSFFNARVRGIDSYDGGGCYVLGRHGIMIMVGLPGDQVRLGIQYVTSDPGSRPTKDTFADHVARIFRPFAGETLELVEAHSYRLKSLLAGTWQVPGAVLLGDAAHTVHPTGGQGMNLAFGDAEAIAAMVPFGAPPAEVDAGARRYARSRYAQVRRVYRRSHLGGLAAGLTHPGALAGRALAVRALHAFPPLHRPVLRRLVDVR